jgi:hypothetical protein
MISLSRKILRRIGSGRLWTAPEARSEGSELPSNPLNDDLFIVEFPKSGATWLCYLMANVNLLLSGDERQRVTFFNLHTFIPDIRSGRILNTPSIPVPHFRIIKSHAPFNLGYVRVFYLVRDPRDVMVSYHIFLNQTGWFGGTLEAVIDHKDFGIGAWCDHVAGWIGKIEPSQSFVLLRYEDLLADASKEVKALYGLLGYDLADELVAKAVERSTIERMRADEAEVNARHPRRSQMEFVRKGQVGGGRAKLADELRQRIERTAAPLMRRLGYLP